MELSFTAEPADVGATLQHFLRSRKVSAELIKNVKYHGAGFFLAGRPVHTNHLMQAGECVRFALPPEPPTTVRPQAIPLAVAYEDDFALVIDKPAGIAVHPTLNYPDGTLANAYVARTEGQGRPAVFRPVNRLDKNTSGLVLCAQNAFAAPLLAQSAQKRYYAVVEGQLPLGSGCIDAPIARRGDSIIGRCVAPGGKPSVTQYEVLAVGGGHSLVCCVLLTGRTHQIRVHFSSIGHPLAGDDLYGGSWAQINRQALHCGELTFEDPLSGALRRLTSPLPADMEGLAQRMNFQYSVKDLPNL